MAKTFETQFKIGAKYTGKPAFVAFARDVTRTSRMVGRAAVTFGSAFSGFLASIGAAAVAYKAFRATVDIGSAAFEAAKDVRKAHDVVRQSSARLVKQGRIQGKDQEERTQEIIALSEAMEKAGGIDAETLQVAFAELSKTLTFDQIKQVAKGFQDWTVTMNKGAPTLEQITQDAETFNKVVLKGKMGTLPGIAKEQAKAFNKLKGPTERATKAVQLFGKESGATSEWMKSDEGATYQLSQSQEALLETMGEPGAAQVRAITDALTDLMKALTPVAEVIAKNLAPRLQELSKWISDNKDEIATFAKSSVEWAFWLGDMLVKSIQDTVSQAKATWVVLSPIWEETKRQWKELTEYFGSIWNPLWANTLKEIATIKKTFADIVDWLDLNFIKPIYNLFNWLWDNLKGIWDKIITKLKEVKTAHVGTSVPLTSEAYTGGGMATDFQEAEAKQEKAVQRATKQSEANKGVEPALPENEPDFNEPNPLVPDMSPAASPPALVPTGSSLKDTIKKMNMRDRMGGSGGTNVAVNPTINVHGVPTGKENAVGQAVAKAMRDSTRDLLDRIKAARNYESRLGYV